MVRVLVFLMVLLIGAFSVAQTPPTPAPPTVSLTISPSGKPAFLVTCSPWGGGETQIRAWGDDVSEFPTITSGSEYFEFTPNLSYTFKVRYRQTVYPYASADSTWTPHQPLTFPTPNGLNLLKSGSTFTLSWAALMRLEFTVER